jgi:tRNA pseudouridine38-40 synthase
MRDALQYLHGEHDFSSFRAAECQAKSPVKELRVAQIDQVGSMFVFRFSADAFLHHMVRNILGSLVHVGAGQRPSKWMKQVLDARDRRVAAPTFAAAGLYLCAVEYDCKWGLPEPDNFIPAELMVLAGISNQRA